jgi:dTDP-4-dehydrorhamnose 3,5-epimerase-like enzyme
LLKAPFSENDDCPEWFRNFGWIRQINRSLSSAGVVRGCHAQTGKFCQGKLVSALTEKIYDVITDARPDSDTFGVSKAYILDPAAQNMLWVPRGFLHAFCVPLTVKSPALFEYFCDNVYDKSSETGVAPASLLPKVANGVSDMASTCGLPGYDDFINLFASDLKFSDKDKAAADYETWIGAVREKYEKTGKAWYR